MFGNNDKDRVKYVATEDFDGMLAMRGGRKALFTVYSAPDPEPEIELTPEEKQQVKPDNGVEQKEIDATKAAIRLAEEHDIDLQQVKGSGKDGRIVKQDVLRHPIGEGIQKDGVWSKEEMLTLASILQDG